MDGTRGRALGNAWLDWLRLRDEGMLKTVQCDLCAADDTELVYEEKDYLHHTDGTFSLVRCRRCGLMYLNPRPSVEEMPRYYPESYEPHRPIDSQSPLLVRLEHRYAMHKHCRAIIAHTSVGSGRILEIGCSTGSFLAAMRARGWLAHGIEISSNAARYAQRERGLDVFVGTLDKAHYPRSHFDVVALWNVFEHLHRPKATLTEIARILKPTGLLAMSIPNPDSIEAKVFGQYWAGLDAPRHLYIYTQRTIRKALAETGFDMERVISFSGRHHVLALSTNHWLDQTAIGPERLRHLLKQAISSFPARLLTLPYYILASKLNQNSVMTVLARRRKEII